MIEYYKENWINWECRYWLKAIESCRSCLFDTLCRLEKDAKKRQEKEKSDLSDNNDK